MSRFRFFILPRICLALSALALLTGLWVLWLSLGRPMPTRLLACRQAETASLLPHGRMAASGPIHMEEAQADWDAWALLQAGEQYSLVQLTRTAGLLWAADGARPIDLGDGALYVLSADSSIFWEPGEFWRDDYDPHEDEVPYSEAIPLAVCTDPAVVRLEGEYLLLGHWEDPQTAWAERASPITWSPAGEGIWVGAPVSSAIPERPDGSGGHSGTGVFRCRGYDADGNLVCSFDSSAD